MGMRRWLVEKMIGCLAGFPSSGGQAQKRNRAWTLRAAASIVRGDAVGYTRCTAGVKRIGQAPRGLGMDERGFHLFTLFLHSQKSGDGCIKSVAFLALVAMNNGKSVHVAHRSVALVMKESKG